MSSQEDVGTVEDSSSAVGTNVEEISKSEPTKTSKPTSQPEPINTLSPNKALKNDIGERISGENVTVDILDNIVFVTFSAQDMLSTKWTRDEIGSDTLSILHIIKNSSVPFQTVSVQATFPLQDAFGNVKEGVVFSGSYSADTVNRINFEELVQIFSITDEPAFIHPDFLGD